MSPASDGRPLARFVLAPGLHQEGDQFLKVFRISLHSRVNGCPQIVTVGSPLGVLGALFSFPVGARHYDRKPMLQTQPVTDPLQGQPGQMEIPELPGAVQGGGIEDDVIVDMRPVGVGGNDKGVFAFREAHPQLIADTVGLLRRDLARFEGLAYLVGDDIMFLAAARHVFVLPL